MTSSFLPSLLNSVYAALSFSLKGLHPGHHSAETRMATIVAFVTEVLLHSSYFAFLYFEWVVIPPYILIIIKNNNRNYVILKVLKDTNLLKE